MHFLQIWIVPDQKNVKPSYQQMHFDEASKRGRLQLIISPDGQDGSLALNPDRFAYIHVATGEVEINGYQYHAGDGVRIRKEQTLTFGKGDQSEVLLFDLRPYETPFID